MDSQFPVPKAPTPSDLFWQVQQSTGTSHVYQEPGLNLSHSYDRATSDGKNEWQFHSACGVSSTDRIDIALILVLSGGGSALCKSILHAESVPDINPLGLLICIKSSWAGMECSTVFVSFLLVSEDDLSTPLGSGISVPPGSV